MFYTYNQNNSGGSFYGPQYVIIEADRAEFADIIAEDHGVYFNGVENGMDCECCGDRWNRAWYEGTDEPLIYGKRPDEYESWWSGGDILIVYKNGTTKTISINKKKTG